MDNIAFMIGGLSITWHGLIFALALAGGSAAALLLCDVFGVKRSNVLYVLLGGFVAGMLFSRLVYWYCCPEKYSGFFDALFDFGHGGESLLGAMIGVVLAAFIVSRAGKEPFLRLLDCLAPAGALAIGLGRLSSFFTADDYGKITYEAPEKQHFPIALSVEGADGMPVWRFPTFFYESIAGLLMFVLLIVMILRRFGDEYDDRKRGSVFFMFLSMLCCSQIVFESTRYDVLYLRSNGFVSLFQIVGAAGVIGTFVFFAIRAAKAREGENVTGQLVMVSAVVLLLLGNAGYMEYLVQRHANQYFIYYPLMAACMAAVCTATWLLCVKGEREADEIGE